MNVYNIPLVYYNPASNNMQTLIIWQLRGLAPSSEVLLFTRKCFVSETGISQGYFQRCLQGCVFINILVSSDPLSPAPVITSLGRNQ